MKSILLVALLFLHSLAVADEYFYVGVWQSDKAKTLESMREVEDIPQKAIELFEGDFFGRLVNVVKKDSFATYFVDDKPKEIVFIPAEIEILAPNKVRTKCFDQDSGLYTETITTYEGNCYSLTVGKWGFKEYFCKIE